MTILVLTRPNDGTAGGVVSELERRGLLLTLPVRWVSHPSRVADAEFKPLQLQLASECGLRVPRTLITNDAVHVQEFVEQLSGPMIYKPMSTPSVRADGELRLIYATQVDSSALREDDIGITAHLFQEWVPKEYDVRLTIVGDRFFAVAIHASSDRAYVDWRSDYGALKYESIETPEDVRYSIGALLGRFGLLFGAVDFTVTPSGEWVFLELNPNGQWGWIEDHTNLPITTAVADLLAGGNAP
jgi:glutathione synthase/RimK-type ligase-like ATP-grasp enzyme